MARFPLVLDSNEQAAPHNWRASAIADRKDDLRLQHDRTCCEVI